MKRSLLLRLIATLLTLLTLSATLLACTIYERDEGERNDGFVTTGPESEYPDDPIFEAYSNWNYESFAKLKVLEVKDGYYSGPYYYAFKIYRCEIVEDYYGLMNAGEKVDLAVYVNNPPERTTYDEAAVTSALDAEYLLAHFKPTSSSFTSLDGTKTHSKGDAKMGITDLFYRVIPIVEGTLSVDKIDTFLQSVGATSFIRSLPEFTSYIKNGATEAEVKAAITLLDADIERAFLKKGFIYTNKRSVEVTDEDGLDGKATVTILNVDPYLNDITLTIKNNTESDINFYFALDYTVDGTFDKQNHDSFRLLDLSGNEVNGKIPKGKSQSFKIVPINTAKNGKAELFLIDRDSPDKEALYAFTLDINNWCVR